jgi:hypothetical protein
MGPRIPDENERRKLQKMARFYHLLPIYGISLLGIFFINDFFLDQYPMLGAVLTVAILVAVVYLLLNFALLKRCPRCCSWGTPIMRGHCPRCGLHLDPSYRENRS